LIGLSRQKRFILAEPAMEGEQPASSTGFSLCGFDLCRAEQHTGCVLLSWLGFEFFRQRKSTAHRLKPVLLQPVHPGDFDFQSLFLLAAESKLPTL